MAGRVRGFPRGGGFIPGRTSCTCTGGWLCRPTRLGAGLLPLWRLAVGSRVGKLSMFGRTLVCVYLCLPLRTVLVSVGSLYSYRCLFSRISSDRYDHTRLHTGRFRVRLRCPGERSLSWLPRVNSAPILANPRKLTPDRHSRLFSQR